MSSRQVFGRWNGFFSGVQLSMKLVETGFSNRSNSTFWPKENKDAVTEEENQRCNASGHSTGRGAKKDRFRKSRHQNNSYCYGKGKKNGYLQLRYKKRELRTGSASETCCRKKAKQNGCFPTEVGIDLPPNNTQTNVQLSFKPALRETSREGCREYGRPLHSGGRGPMSGCLLRRRHRW